LLLFGGAAYLATGIVTVSLFPDPDAYERR